MIGLHLDPPEQEVALCCDKETLSREPEPTQPALRLGVGLRRTKTHDCVRHGTIDLFAAMSCLEGKLTRCTGRKGTRLAWLFFPQQFHREVPKELDIHLIAGNYSTHNQAKLREWPSRCERLHVHFTPTAASWMNLVERFFADLAADCGRAGSLASVKDLTAAMTAQMEHRDENPRP